MADTRALDVSKGMCHAAQYIGSNSLSCVREILETIGNKIGY